VLNAKNSYRWVEPVIARNATIKETIEATIDRGLSGMMVVEETDPNSNNNSVEGGEHHQKRVVGLVTSRDLLRIMSSGIKDGLSNDQILDECVVGDFMTPISQVIYARPDETVGMCRTIMAKLGIKCLPVLSRQGKVEGLVTAKDMADFGLSAKEKGGKQAYLNDISERVGLSSSTSMAEPPNYLKAQLALEHNPLYMNIGVSALPHPFKTASGSSQRGTILKKILVDFDCCHSAVFW
jgi:CBS domain-containing protein